MRRTGGWLLIEIVLMLAMISLLLIVESRLFVGVVRQWSGTRQAETQVAQFDHAVSVLRADVWGAQRLEVDAEGARLVVQRGSGAITWSAGQAVMREAVGEAKSWSDTGQTWRFAADGPKVTLHIRSAAGVEAEIGVVSQVLLAGVTP